MTNRSELVERFERLEAAVERLEDKFDAALAGADAALLHDRVIGPIDVAGRIGMSPQWVREHCEQLGGWRDGDGPKARYCFRFSTVAERLRAMEQGAPASPGRTNRRAAGHPPAESKPRGRRKRSAPTGVELLPIRGGKS